MEKQKDELIVQMALGHWKSGLERVDRIFGSISDEQYISPIRQGFNNAA